MYYICFLTYLDMPNFTYVQHMSALCFFSYTPVNVCLHAKTYLNVMYYMRSHNVYVCITLTNLTYNYIIQTHVRHDRRNKKHISDMFSTDRKRHVKT